ncbi:MAG: VanZ family protein [Nocardioides sp.]
MFSDDVWRYLPLAPIPTLIVGVAVVALLFLVGLRDSRAVRRLAAVLLAGSALAILGLTLSGGDESLGRSVNLHPGAGIRVELDNVNHALGVVNVLGNLALFVPFGWLVALLALYDPAARASRGLLRGFMGGLVLSVAVETAQYLLGRSADIDDVLLNTGGALVGAAIGVALSRIRRSRSSGQVTPRASREEQLIQA